MLIVAGDGWHRGVIGIVASKLVEIVPQAGARAVDRGRHRARIGPQHSRRSICSAALEACADVFLRFGGHRQAAGVTLEAARLGELRRRLTAWANDRAGPGRSRAAAADRRAARAARDLGRRRRGPGAARAVRRGESEAGVSRVAGRSDRAAARAEGTAPGAAVQAGRPGVPRHRLARRRARGLSHGQSLRARAGVFARAGRVSRREDDRADGRRRARPGEVVAP